MKRLYIDDTIHEQLKRDAKANGRTLQWWIEMKLTSELDEPVYPKKIVTASSEAIQKAKDMTDERYRAMWNAEASHHLHVPVLDEPTIVPIEDN